MKFSDHELEKLNNVAVAFARRTMRKLPAGLLGCQPEDIAQSAWEYFLRNWDPGRSGAATFLSLR